MPSSEPAPGFRPRDNVYDKVKRKHCGQKYEYYRFTDAAGSVDWNYREVK